MSNQDWLDKLLIELGTETLFTVGMGGNQAWLFEDKCIKLRAEARQIITPKIAEERIEELTSLKTKKVKGANLVELKWVDGRIAELEALRGKK